MAVERPPVVVCVVGQGCTRGAREEGDDHVTPGGVGLSSFSSTSKMACWLHSLLSIRSSAVRVWASPPKLPLGRSRVLLLMSGWNMVEPPLWLRLPLLHQAGYQHLPEKRVRRVKRKSAMDTDDLNAESQRCRVKRKEGGMDWLGAGT